MSEFTSRMENILQDKNLKRADIVRGTGIPEGTIRQWKKGSVPNAEAAIKVANFLGVSVEWLVFGTAEAPDKTKQDNLNEEEKEIIKIFRMLNDHDKDIIVMTLRNLYSLAQHESGGKLVAEEGKPYNSL